MNRYNQRKGCGCGWLLTTIIIIVVLCGGIVYLKNEGKLGAIKNKIFRTPTESVATVTQGLNEGHKTVEDTAHEELAEQGRDAPLPDDVSNKYLEQDEFFTLDNMYQFPNQYAIFFFSNTKADDKWIPEIKKARKAGLTVKTFNANMVGKDDETFVYRYLHHNYTVDKDSKKYGKNDGKKHPFMVLFNDHTPRKIIVKSSDEKKLFTLQQKMVDQANEDANNYDIPDNDVGIPAPKFGKAIEKGKEYARKIQQQMTN